MQVRIGVAGRDLGIARPRCSRSLLKSRHPQSLPPYHSDLYAIIKTTEKLERSYVRDAMTAKDYEPACQRLIAHYKTLWETVKESVPSIQSFMAAYHLQCPMGARRLAQSGMPATVEHGGKPGGSASEGNYTAAVADAVGQYITTMDALKLNRAAVDQIFPLLSDLTQTLNKVGVGVDGKGGGMVFGRGLIPMLLIAWTASLNKNETTRCLWTLFSLYSTSIAPPSSFL